MARTVGIYVFDDVDSRRAQHALVRAPPPGLAPDLALVGTDGVAQLLPRRPLLACVRPHEGTKQVRRCARAHGDILPTNYRMARTSAHPRWKTMNAK